ncbi:sugar kinase [Alkalihalobacillus sp. AL-G]|nr:sugar kinase [Alkalihalobacillus sp. AL-G]WLD95336.1 sugar kinase [Alkalihalobacillus sp. AL-G]
MDVITFGESMVLFSPMKTGRLRYISQFEKTIGGAESNVAIALARLGYQVSWVSRLGDDEFGLFVRNFIRGEGVDTSLVTFDPDHPTGVFFKERHEEGDPKVYYYRTGSAASYMNRSHLSESDIAGAKILHITGITAALSHSCRELIHYAIDIAKENDVTVVFDPNIRLKLWSENEARSELMSIAGKCDIVLPGLEEGRLLTAKTEPEDISESLISIGAKAVVVKLGAKGAYYHTSDSCEFIEGCKVGHVVDTIGAGDGFAAGFISGVIRNWTYREAVKLGNRVGASAVTVTGDVEGYPYWSEIVPDRSKDILR